MPQNLVNMDVREVSLVDDPANPGAHVLFAKNKGSREVKSGDQENQSGFIKALGDLMRKSGLWSVTNNDARTFDQLAVTAETQEMIDVLNRSLSDINSDAESDDAAKGQMMQQSISEFLTATGMLAATAKAAKAAQGQTTEEQDMDISKLKPEDKATLLKALQEDAETVAKAAADKGAADKAAAAKADVAKGGAAVPDLSEQISKALTTAMEPVLKQLDAANAVIKSLTDEKSQTALVNKAAALTKSLTGVTAEGLADVMKGMSDDQQAKLTDILKAAGEQAEAGRSALFKSIGGRSTPVAGSAEEVAKQRAAEAISKNTSGKPMSESQALAKVWNEDPALYDRYLKETGAN